MEAGSVTTAREAAPAAGASHLLADVLYGLQPGVRKLPPKYFYDDVGARLFERITTLDEYYPTRTETAILEAHGEEMAAALGPRVRLVEFGSGSGEKTRLLLRRLREPASYVPVDIAYAQLRAFAADVGREFPGLAVEPHWGDYMQPLHLAASARAARTVAFFPGSTIGNMETLQAAAFLRRVASLCGAGGGLLLGTDMHKDSAILEPAYNDAAGVTAEFNLNMLRRINRELGADFDLDGWEHCAFYDRHHRRIEMRLIARRDCAVAVPLAPSGSARFSFRAGEWITTEYSHKYTEDSVRALAASGWRVERSWSDEAEWFGVWLLTSTGHPRT
jgi:L-histidine Nalpha-methyltransferase